MENSMEIPHKLKMELLYDPAITLLNTQPKDLNSGSQEDNSTPMFFAALFTMAKIWKRPNCPSTGEQIKKMLYVHTVNISRLKKESQQYATTGMNLEKILLSKRRHLQKDKYYMMPLNTRCLKQSYLQTQSVEQWLPAARGMDKWEVINQRA